MDKLYVSIPEKRTIHIERSSGILIMSLEEIAMRKARFTEHQIIAVLKSVEAGRTVKGVCPKLVFPKPAITTGKRSSTV